MIKFLVEHDSLNLYEVFTSIIKFINGLFREITLNWDKLLAIAGAGIIAYLIIKLVF